MASVSIGRSRFPPEEIRWLATSGIIVTSEPVRDRMAALTRSMSAATSSIRASMDAPEGLSKGTITATRVSSFAMLETTIGTAAAGGKGGLALTRLRHCRAVLARHRGRRGVLRELVRTNDIVLVSAIGALLDGAN